jgi:hypothetical protein
MRLESHCPRMKHGSSTTHVHRFQQRLDSGFQNVFFMLTVSGAPQFLSREDHCVRLSEHGCTLISFKSKSSIVRMSEPWVQLNFLNS